MHSLLVLPESISNAPQKNTFNSFSYLYLDCTGGPFSEEWPPALPKKHWWHLSLPFAAPRHDVLINMPASQLTCYPFPNTPQFNIFLISLFCSLSAIHLQYHLMTLAHPSLSWSCPDYDHTLLLCMTMNLRSSGHPTSISNCHSISTVSHAFNEQVSTKFHSTIAILLTHDAKYSFIPLSFLPTRYHPTMYLSTWPCIQLHLHLSTSLIMTFTRCPAHQLKATIDPLSTTVHTIHLNPVMAYFEKPISHVFQPSSSFFSLAGHCFLLSINTSSHKIILGQRWV